MLRIDTFAVNGPPTRTSGYDLRSTYDWNGWFDASYQVGVEATYLKEYQRGAFTLLGAPTSSSPRGLRPGRHPSTCSRRSSPIPKTRANFWLNWPSRQHQRPLPAALRGGHSRGDQHRQRRDRADAERRRATATPAGTIGKLKDFWQHDITVQADLPWDTQLTVSIQNILDKDPPDAPSNYNYDYTPGTRSAGCSKSV